MKKFFLLILIGLSLKSQAQKTPQHHLDSFFKKFQDDQIQAIQDLFFTNEWFRNNPESILPVLTQIETANSKLGNYYGFELIQSKKISDSYMFFTYLMKYNIQPIRFNFIFLNPKINGCYKDLDLMTN